MTKNELVGEIMKAVGAKGEKTLDKLCEHPKKHLEQLLRAINNLKK